jgi:putative colanic acid biosynthesis UDP-glucose lipid carrier transferase
MGLLAYWLRFGHVSMPVEYERAVSRALLFTLFVFGSSSIYRSWRGRSLFNELVNMTWLWTLVFAVGLLYVAALKLDGAPSRLWWGTWFVGCVAATGGARIVIRSAASLVRQKGLDHRTAVIVGVGHDSYRVVEALRSHPSAGIDVVGWFSTSVDSSKLTQLPHLGDVDSLAGYVDERHIDQVWIALPMSAQDKINRVLERLAHSAVDIKFVPDLFGLHLLNHSVEQIAGVPVINVQQSPLQGSARVIKAIEDRLFASMILIAISPLMLMIAVAVKLSSPGPVFYRQERVSWNNKRFHMLKFRSMPIDAESKTGAIWAKAGEARATRVGSFLRRTSLDELPQFINVLKGDMSIVGPRPERPVFVEKFKHDIPAYMKKHMVKAGITGWAQVNGWRGNTDLKRRIECDLFYIENWSLAFDIRILLLTIYKGFINKNAY